MATLFTFVGSWSQPEGSASPIGAQCNIPRSCGSFAMNLRQFAFMRRSSFVRPPTQSIALRRVKTHSTASATHRQTLSMVIGSNPWVVLTALLWSTCAGLLLSKTKIGTLLSAPLITMFCTLFLTNVGFLPASSMVYQVVNSYLVPIGVTLLLFAADLRRIFKETGQMLGAFLVATLGVVVGTIAAAYAFPMKSLGADNWKVASMLAARHIGGAINAVAVADALQITPAVFAGCIAADNVLVALFFMFLFYLGRNEPDPVLQDSSLSVGTKDTLSTNPSVSNFVKAAEENDMERTGDVSLIDLATCLTLGSIFCTMGGYLSNAVPILNQFGMVPVSTFVALVFINLFPKFFKERSAAANSIGVFCMQMFFAVTGACGSLATVAKAGPAVLGHTILQMIIHLVILLGLGKLLRFKLPVLLLASDCAYGGVATSGAMASARNWKSQIVPAILAAIFGYIVATFIGLVLGKWVLIRIM